MFAQLGLVSVAVPGELKEERPVMAPVRQMEQAALCRQAMSSCHPRRLPPLALDTAKKRASKSRASLIVNAIENAKSQQPSCLLR